MRKPLIGEKIAVLVANGFCEKDLTALQRALQPLGATMRIISMDHGLVNSWNDGAWGLNFAADSALSAALAADFSMLLIPGGSRSIEKLKLTAHTRRFIGGFADTGKPVVVCREALDLLIFADKLAGRTVSGLETLKDAAVQAGATWADAPFTIDNNLMTGVGVQAETPEQSAEFVNAVMEFLTSSLVAAKAA